MIIDLIGDIDHEMYKDLVKKLRKAEDAKIDVTLAISSHGGDAAVALAIYDRIKYSSVKINTSAIGAVSSAAVLVLAAGDYRMMFSNAWVMVHEESYENMSGNATYFEKLAVQARKQELQWAELLEKVTFTSKSKWLDLHREETYLTAEDCLRMGLIEEII